MHLDNSVVGYVLESNQLLEYFPGENDEISKWRVLNPSELSCKICKSEIATTTPLCQEIVNGQTNHKKNISTNFTKKWLPR